MDNQEADGQNISTFKTIPISLGIASLLSPYPGLVERSSFAEANKRLKKLERDYQHTYNKCTELQTGISTAPNYDVQLISSWAGYCINHSENLVEQLKKVLDKLNTEEEATQRGRETPRPSYVKAKNEEHYNDGLSQETINVKNINKEFRYIQRIIPKSSSKKPTHDLLRRVKEIKKLTEKAISNGALVGNRISQDDMKNSTSIEIKLLKKLIRGFEKERGETENILQDKRRIEKEYREKMRHLEEKCEWIDEKRSAEKKYILDLKKTFRSMHKTASQRKAGRKGQLQRIAFSVNFSRPKRATPRNRS